MQRLFLDLSMCDAVTKALQEIITTDDFFNLNADLLDNLDLAKLNSHLYNIGYELYRELVTCKQNDELYLQRQINLLLIQNIYLKYLCNIDDLTQLYNKRYFCSAIENFWRQLAFENAPLSLIFLDIDNLKIYNLIKGTQAGDECVRQIANVISLTVEKTNGVVARYEDDTFVVLLPRSKIEDAYEISESIREEVKRLAIKHAIAKIGGLELPVVTVSLGVASVIPKLEQFPQYLIDTAIEALQHSKKLQGDCTCVSKVINYE